MYSQVIAYVESTLPWQRTVKKLFKFPSTISKVFLFSYFSKVLRLHVTLGYLRSGYEDEPCPSTEFVAKQKVVFGFL